MQGTKLSFENVDLGDSKQTSQTYNQGEEDFLDQFSFLMLPYSSFDYEFTHVV
jgi:hypothetical protein